MSTAAAETSPLPVPEAPRSPSTAAELPTRLSLDAPHVLMRSQRRVVLAASLLLGVVALVVAYRRGLTLQFGDEASHLLAARQVYDSISPGFGQIGQYWLPLFHLMELPLVWIDPLYTNGLAGAIPAAAAYVAAVVGAHTLGAELTRNRVAALLAASTVALNPVMLYMAVRPMMETTTVAAAIWAVAMLARYRRLPDLHTAGRLAFALSLATLAYYPLWALPVLAVVVMVFVGVSAGYPWARIKLHVLVACAPALALILVWLAWCYAIQGDPFYFLSEVSAATSATDSSSSSASATVSLPAGNAAFALLSTLLAAVHVLGPGVLVITLGVLAAGMVRARVDHPLAPLLPAFFFIPAAYVVFGGLVGSPLLGELVNAPDTAQIALDNNQRYLLVLLPFAAGALAIWAARGRVAASLSALAVVLAMLTPLVIGLGLPTPYSTGSDTLMRATISQALRERVVERDFQDQVSNRTRPTQDKLVLFPERGSGKELLLRSGLDARLSYYSATDKRQKKITPGQIRFVITELASPQRSQDLLARGYRPVPIKPAAAVVRSNGAVRFDPEFPDAATPRLPQLSAPPALVPVSAKTLPPPPPGYVFSVNGYILWERP